MIDIIILVFLCLYVKKLALRKGLVPKRWIINTIIAWLSAEFLGLALGVSLFGKNNMLAISAFALFCALGGYLFIHAQLQKIPDIPDKDPNDLL